MFAPRDQRASGVALPKVVCLGLYGACELTDEALSRQRILTYLHDHVTTLHATVYAVCAVGGKADLLLAECCIEAGLPVRILLPDAVDKLAERFAPDLWPRWEQVIAKALAADVVCVGLPPREGIYEAVLRVLQESSTLLVLTSNSGDAAAAEALVQGEATGKPMAILNVVSGVIERRNTASPEIAMQDEELSFLNGLTSVRPAPSQETGLGVAHAWFASMDGVATGVAPRMRRSAAIPIWYTSAASVITGAASHSTSKFWMIAIILIGIGAVALPALLRLDKTQSLWARARVAAEVSRSALATWDVPSRYETREAETVIELGAVLRSLHFLKLEAGRGITMDLITFRERYRTGRIVPQIAYFSRHAGLARERAQRYRKIVWGCGVSSILLALLWLGDHTGLSPVRGATHGPWFGVGLSILFQAATVTSALAIIHDGARRQQRYLELHRFLSQQERQFATLWTWSAVVRATNQVERALLVEVIEWRSLARHRKLSRR